MAVSTENDNVINQRLAIDLDLLDKRSSFSSSFRNHLTEFKKVLFMFPVFLKLAFFYAKSHKLPYCAGFLSVLLVVSMVVLLPSVIGNLPLVFLRLGEMSNGQNDLVITPASEIYSSSSLNYSVIEELFPSNDPSRGYHSPRITWTTSIINFDNCKKITNVSALWIGNDGKKCNKGCVKTHCGNLSARYPIVAINSERETRMGFGSSLRGVKINKGEVILSKNVAKAVGVKNPGDIVLIHSDVGVPFREAFAKIPSFSQKTYSIMKMKVVRVTSPDFSKLKLTDFIIINYDSSLADVAEGTAPDISDSERMSLKKITPKLCATSIHFNLPRKERKIIYETGDYVSIKRSITLWASTIVDSVGFDQIYISAPIINFLNSVKFLMFYVQMLVFIILFSLIFLSIMLLYSLLNLTLETHTYELGVKRMIGFSQMHLSLMLFVNAYSFIIPSWLTGLLFGYILYIATRTFVGSLLDVQMPLAPSGTVFGFATFAGLVFPLVAFILPVFSLISQKLSDALKGGRGKNAGVVYKIRRQNDFSSFNYLMLTLGLLFSVFSFLIYFFLPAAIMRMNFEHLLYIFFAVLIAMMVGLLILSFNIERILQMVISYLFFFWESAAVFQAFQNCLIAHRIRNRKISMMYSFSVAFIILVTITFGIQLRRIKYSNMADLGAEIVIYARELHWSDLADLALYIRMFLPEVTGLTYITQATSFFSVVGKPLLSNIGRYKVAELNSLRGVPPNYFDTIDKQFLRVDSYIPQSREHTLTGALYTEERNLVIISATTNSFLESNSLDDPVLLTTPRITSHSKGTTKAVRFAVKPSAVLSSSAQVTMSNFVREYGDLLASIPSAVRYTGIDYLGIRALPIWSVNLRVSDLQHVSAVSKAVREYLLKHKIDRTRVVDIMENNDYLHVADSVLGFFAAFTLVVALAMCFFALFGNMTANVANSTKEIGIYRSVGMTKFQVHRIFIWEAFILVVSAAIIGTFVGAILGYAMYLQDYLFLRLELPFVFPYVQVLIAFAMGVVSAILASYSPVAVLLNLGSVTEILRLVY